MSDAALNLKAAVDRVADAAFFLSKMQTAVSLEGVIERRKLNLANWHVSEAMRLLGGATETAAPVPSARTVWFSPSTVDELVAMAKGDNGKEGV